MKRAGFILLLIWMAAGVFAQDKSLYEKHWFVKGSDTMPYRILLPLNYDPAKKYPLILFLHGAGERGNDNEKQLVHGAGLFLRDSIRQKYPAIVVFPQCPVDSYWSNVMFAKDSTTNRRSLSFDYSVQPTVTMKLLRELIDELEDKYRLDKKRYYVGGLSMGGMGTFELAYRQPKKFAAAFPICGGGDTTVGKKLKRTAWWIFHGLKDDVVPPHLSQSMVDAIQQGGGDVKLTLYPEANHNSWDPAFAEKELLQWLFSQRK